MELHSTRRTAPISSHRERRSCAAGEVSLNRELTATAIELDGLSADRLSTIFAALDIDDARNVHGRYSVLAGCGMTMVRASTTGGRFHVARRRRHIENDPSADCFVCLPVSGQVRLHQQGRDCALDRGDLGIIDAQSPYEVEVASGCDALWIRLPLDALQLRAAAVRRVTARKVDGSAGIGLLAASNARMMFEQLPALPAHARPALSAILFDLLGQAAGAAAEVDEPFRQASARTLDRARAFIERHLEEEDLTPARIATGIGISQRYLSDLFAREGETTMGHVVARRLDRCRAALARQVWQPGLVTQIVFAHGFANLSSFNRMFRAAYGCTPRQVMRSFEQG